MAAVTPNNATRVGVRAAVNCTDLSLDWPHGGVGLGLVGRVEWRQPDGRVFLPGPEDGSVRAVVYTGGPAVLSLTLEEEHPDDVIALVYPETSLSNGRRVVEWHANAPRPTPALTNLVLTPHREGAHNGLVLYRPVPHVGAMEAATARWFSSIRYKTTPLIVVGTPDSAGKVAAEGPWGELSL